MVNCAAPPARALDPAGLRANCASGLDTPSLGPTLPRKKELVLAFFADLGRFPEAVILPSRPVGGVWLRDYLLCFATCTWPTALPSFSTATACRSKEFSSSTALQSTRIRGRGGGGLTARRKRKSSLLRPPPPLFPESRSQKGGA